jgi:hypothetical protein
MVSLCSLSITMLTIYLRCGTNTSLREWSSGSRNRPLSPLVSNLSSRS